MDMNSFVGFSPEFALLNFQRTGHAVYLNISKKRVPKKRVRALSTSLNPPLGPFSKILLGALNCHARPLQLPLLRPSCLLSATFGNAPVLALTFVSIRSLRMLMTKLVLQKCSELVRGPLFPLFRSSFSLVCSFTSKILSSCYLTDSFRLCFIFTVSGMGNMRYRRSWWLFRSRFQL